MLPGIRHPDIAFIAYRQTVHIAERVAVSEKAELALDTVDLHRWFGANEYPDTVLTVHTDGGHIPPDRFQRPLWPGRIDFVPRHRIDRQQIGCRRCLFAGTAIDTQCCDDKGDHKGWQSARAFSLAMLVRELNTLELIRITVNAES